MAAKQVLVGSEIRARMLAGAKKLANAVQVTLGPQGRNVCLENLEGSPLNTNDGVSVAKEIELHDRWENLGARLLREVASKTSDDAGDGTTTSTVLAYSMLEQAHKLVEAGFAPINLKRGMDAALDAVLGEVDVYREEVSSQEDIERIATISANGDAAIGHTIADAIAKVGRDGVVNIEEGKTTGVVTETTEGLQINSGVISSAFFTEPETASSSLEDPWVFVTDMELTSLRPLMDLLENVKASGRPIIWVAPDFDGDALNMLCTNFGSKVIISQLVKAPGFGFQRRETLKDIAAVTGATLITRELGHRFLDVTLEYLGTCRAAKLTSKTTTLLDGGGSDESVEARIGELRGALDRAGSQFDQEKIQERISKLQGGVCAIKVGADTELELKELKGRMEDALYAARSALDEGTVVGGGMALLQASKNVTASFEAPEHPEEAEGWKLVLEACKAPFRAMVQNAYASPDKFEYLLDAMDFEVSPNMGVNVRTLQVVPCMREAGILDPVKVVRMALSNAVSLVGTMITTEAGIILEDDTNTN